MAIGDYFSNMFLGDAGGQEESGDTKRGIQELWKIYQQAYNVKPVFNAKTRQWVMPSGAVQRFQMLLPLINAQLQASRKQGGQGGNDKGILAPLLTKGISGAGNWALDKAGGWGGLMDKALGGVKGLWDAGADKLNYSTDYGFDQQAAQDLDNAFSGGGGAPAMDIPQTYDADIGADLSGLSGFDGGDMSWADTQDFQDALDWDSAFGGY